MTGEKTAMPSGWKRNAAGQFCLTCRRETAGERAVEKAPAGSDHEARAQLRRDAILVFELKREPERPNAAIAQVCRATGPAVEKVRRRLGIPDHKVPAAGTGNGAAKRKRR